MSAFHNSPDGQQPQGVFLLDPTTGLPTSPNSVTLSGPVTVSNEVEIKNDAGNPVLTEPLGVPAVARQLAAGTVSANTVLTATCRRISIRARFADIRFAIGTGVQTANATTSHFIAMDERLDFAVPANAQIAVIRDTAATVNGSLALTELV